MPVVQIRPVRMRMRHRLMVMPMRMLDCRVEPFMIMRVMLIIVAVPVGMTQCRMVVSVGMAFDQQQRNPHHKQKRSDHVQAVQPLTKQNRRQ